MKTFEYYKLRREILDVYEKSGEAITDRKVANRGGFRSMNQISHMIDDLIEDGTLRLFGYTVCEVTSGTVRLVVSPVHNLIGK